EQIAEQRLRFVRAVTQRIVVFDQIFRARDLHAARDPAHYGGAFVLREIVSGAHAQVREYTAEQLFVEKLLVRLGQELLLADEIGKPGGELAHRKHKIRDTTRDGAARHRGVLRLGRLLHQDDATRLLHGARAYSAVGTRAAQDDGESVTEAIRHG